MGQIGPGDIGANLVLGTNLALFILQCTLKLLDKGQYPSVVHSLFLLIIVSNVINGRSSLVRLGESDEVRLNEAQAMDEQILDWCKNTQEDPSIIYTFN